MPKTMDSIIHMMRDLLDFDVAGYSEMIHICQIEEMSELEFPAKTGVFSIVVNDTMSRLGHRNMIGMTKLLNVLEEADSPPLDYIELLSFIEDLFESDDTTGATSD